MSLKTILAFLAAAQAVAADSSHPVYFRKADANAAKSVAAFKKVALAPGGDGSLVNEQVSLRMSRAGRAVANLASPGILVLSFYRRRQ